MYRNDDMEQENQDSTAKGNTEYAHAEYAGTNDVGRLQEAKAPLVSVVMPAYNCAATVAESIRSVLSQTCKDFELLIIDDCSADDTRRICESFAAGDDRLYIYTNDANRGVAFSRNLGIQKARGQWVAFIDSDDLWDAHKLELQLTMIRDTGAAVSYTASRFIGSDGSEYGYTLRAKKEMRYAELLRRNLLSCSSVVVRRDLMLRHLFPEGLLHEDYVSWLSILREDDVAVAYGLDLPLLTYRVSKSSRSGHRVRSGLMTYKAYRVVGYGPVTAAALTLRYAVHSISKRYLLYKS